MKKGLSLLIAGAATVYTVCTLVKYKLSSEEKAKDSLEKIRLGWNLGNSLDAHGKLTGWNKPEAYETVWGNPVVTEKQIRTVISEGFNAIRVPVTWYEHIDSDGNVDPEWMNRVQQVVDHVINNNAYCILNIHHDGGEHGWLYASTENFEKYRSRYERLVRCIAEHFRYYGSKLMFEGINEILDSSISWDKPKEADAFDIANRYNQIFVDTVRNSGGRNRRRNLILQTYCGGSTKEILDGFVLPTDITENGKDHLIVSIHNYSPMGFTFPEANWTTLTDEFGSDEDRETIREIADTMQRFSRRLGVPVILGEYGAYNKNNEHARAEYAREVTSACTKRDIVTFWWDAGGIGIFDRKKCVFDAPEVLEALRQGTVDLSTKA